MTDIEVGNLRTEISIDDNDVNRSLAEITREVRVAQSEFKRASVEVEGFGKGTDGLKTKSDALTKTITAQQALVNKLRAEHEKAAREKGEDSRQTQNLEVRYNKAATELAKLQNELRETNTELEKQTTTWQKIGEAVDGFADKAEKVGRRMASVGSEMTMAITAPLAAVGGIATKASVDFESAFAGVRKTVDATEEEFQIFSDGIREMAQNMPQAATEIARVAEAAGQLGIQNNAILGFTETMVNMGVATNMSSDNAAMALARLATITQMSQQDFDRLGATIVGLGNNLAATESEIVDMGLRIAGAGNVVGMAEHQILAFSGALAAVGINAEAGGTAFSKLMVNIASEVATGGQKLEQFAGVAGMSAAQFQQAFQQDAASAIVSFIEGLGKVEQAGGNVFGVLEDLGLTEVRLRDALLRASGAGETLRTSLELGAKAWEENIALTDEAEQRYATAASQMQIFKNRATDAAITLGDSLAPALIAALESAQPLIDGIQKMAERFAELDEGTQRTIITIAALAAAVGPLLLVVGKLATAIGAVTTAVKALSTAIAWVASNPYVVGFTLIAGAVVTLTSAISGARKATEELKQAQEELQRVQREGIEGHEIAVYEEKIQKLDELKAKYLEVVEAASGSFRVTQADIAIAANKLGMDVNELREAADHFGVTLKFFDENGKLAAASMQELEEVTKTLTKAVSDARKETAAQISEQARQIAQSKQEVSTIEALLKTYREAKKGTDEWNQAQSELARMFPQYTDGVEVNAEAIEGLMIVKRQEIAETWAAIQAKAQEILLEKQRELAVREAAIAAVDAGAKWFFGMDNAAGATAKAREEVEKLKGEIASLQSLASSDPSSIAAPLVPFTPTAPKKKETGTYQNKALDEAYRLLEHKKRLDQLTLEEELRTLEQIKSAHVKTADERMAIDEKIHAVKKEMLAAEMNEENRLLEHKKRMGQLTIEQEIETLEMIKRNYARSADEIMDIEERLYDARQRMAEQYKDRQTELLNEATTRYKNSLEDRLVRERLTDEEQFNARKQMYDNIIRANEDYLSRVMQDEQYTAVEREQIQAQITDVIRNNVNERLRLEQDYYNQVRQQEIDAINNLSQGVQAALKAKYEQEKSIAEQALKDQLAANDRWRNESINSIKSVYDYRIKAAEDAANKEIEQINSVLNAQIQAIADELAALDQAEKQRTRAELDADDELKLERLRAKMEYEHDEYNKTQLQKEINKVLADQEERHRKEQLDDHKEALKEEQKSLQDKLREETQAVKDQLAEKKAMLQSDRDAEIARINQISDAVKTSLNNQLAATQAHYAQLLTAKSLQAEAEKMIIQNQQVEILELLNDFGDQYKLTGQTLGEKLYEGFKEKVDQIQTIIAQVNAQIDAMRSAAMSAMAQASAAAAGASAASVTHNNTRNVTVQNNFNSPVTSPSSVNRATQKMAQNLVIGY